MFGRPIRNVQPITVTEEEIVLLHPVGRNIIYQPTVQRIAPRANLDAVERLFLHLPGHLQALQAVEIRGLWRALAAGIVRIKIGHLRYRPDQTQLRRQEVKVIGPVIRHIEPAIDAGRHIGRIVILMRFRAQPSQHVHILTQRKIQLAPDRPHQRVDGVVIVFALRETRVARKEAERFGLDFSQPAACNINIRAHAPGQAVGSLPLKARHHTPTGRAILLHATIRQEVLCKDHRLGVRIRRQGQRAAAEVSRQPRACPRRPRIAVGFRVRIGFGNVLILVGIRPLCKAGRFLVEV